MLAGETLKEKKKKKSDKKVLRSRTTISIYVILVQFIINKGKNYLLDFLLNLHSEKKKKK